MKFCAHCTTADFELDERHVIKNETVALDRHRVRQNVFLVDDIDVSVCGVSLAVSTH